MAIVITTFFMITMLGIAAIVLLEMEQEQAQQNRVRRHSANC